MAAAPLPRFKGLLTAAGDAANGKYARRAVVGVPLSGVVGTAALTGRGVAGDAGASPLLFTTVAAAGAGVSTGVLAGVAIVALAGPGAGSAGGVAGPTGTSSTWLPGNMPTRWYAAGGSGGWPGTGGGGRAK